MVEKPTKEELINHYAGGDIHKFTQIDGWTGDIADSLIKTDKDDDWICLGETYELRRSPKELAVRVFIHEGTERKDALRLLEKIYVVLREKEKKEQPMKPIPEPKIPIETNTIMTVVDLPISLWTKITNYQLRMPKPMLFGEIIISLLETHPALTKEQKKE